MNETQNGLLVWLLDTLDIFLVFFLRVEKALD